jgi:hypothetical protein
MFNGQESLSDYDTTFYSLLSRRFKREKRESRLFYGKELSGFQSLALWPSSLLNIAIEFEK